MSRGAITESVHRIVKAAFFKAGMDVLDIFPTILQHNCTLRCIELTEVFSKTLLGSLVSALSQSKNDRLECIEVHSCGVTNAQFAGFCNALSRQKNLSSLKFLDEGRGIFSNDTILDDENATILRNFLIGHKSLKSFHWMLLSLSLAGISSRQPYLIPSAR